MTIRVLSFDFDGCLFNLHYIRSTEQNVIASNQSLLDYLKSKNHHYSETIVMVGSNRQSKHVDEVNHPRKGSCFPAIKEVADYLDAKLDLFLLADLHGDLPNGTSFLRAISDLPGEKRKCYPEIIQHATWVFDAKKITLLYAQLHKVSKDYPNEDIVFYFYDDKGCQYQQGIDDILEGLHQFYFNYTDLMPSHVKLILNHYAGWRVTPFNEIYGTGFIDATYVKTVKEMCGQMTAVSPVACAQDASLTRCLIKPELLKARSVFIPCPVVKPDPKSLPVVVSYALFPPRRSLFQVVAAREKVLFEAVDRDDTHQIRQLFQRAVNLNARDCYLRTPIFIASESGKFEALKLLCELGSNIALPDQNGRSPLFIAAVFGELLAINLLIAFAEKQGKKEVIINQQDNNGRTPIYVAAEYGELDSMEKLNSLGANLELPDNEGKTPFYIAVESGQVDAVILLFHWRVNITTPDLNGITPSSLKGMPNEAKMKSILSPLLKLYHKRSLREHYMEGFSMFSLLLEREAILESTAACDESVAETEGASATDSSIGNFKESPLYYSGLDNF